MLFVTSLVSLALGIVHLSTASSRADEMFAYSQVMANCVGQSFLDQQTERLVTAVRRCEQIAPQPLKDKALESVIVNLQNGPQVVYVPVGFNGLGGGLPINPLGPFGSHLNPVNPVFGQQFPLTAFSQNPSLGGFNRVDNTQNQNDLDLRRRPDSRLGSSNNRGQSLFGGTNTNINSNSRNDNNNNNQFGFSFGKQTGGEDSTTVLQMDENSEKSVDGKTQERARRQVNFDTRTRLEALNYLSNMTCVMREAGMIDHNNLPNYQFFENELRRVQVSRDLRNDIANGMFFCKDLTQCMQVERLSHPLARELGQAVAYLRCIARTNVKACKKQSERRSQGNSRLTGAFNFFTGNGLDLLNSVTELALSDDALGFDFF